MRLLFVLSCVVLSLAISAPPALPKDAMLNPPKDFGDDIGEGDQPPREPEKIPADMDPNQNPGHGADYGDPDDESMIEKEPSDYKEGPMGPDDNADGDDATLLQVGAPSPAPTPAAATPSPSPAAATPSPSPAAATPSPSPAAATPSPTPAADGKPPSGNNGPPGAGDAGGKGGDGVDPAGGGGNPPAGDNGANAGPPAAGDSPGQPDAPAPEAEPTPAGGASKGPIGRLVNRPKETADPLYSSGTKINKNNAKIYKKVDYSPAKATERAVLTEAQRVINKAKSKHNEFLEDTKEEIEKMLDA